MNSPGWIRSLQALPGGFTWTEKRSAGEYQISSSFSDRSAIPLPTTFHSISAVSSRAAIVPLEWIRPKMKPVSSGLSGFSCPAFPAATHTHLPPRQRASIQRETGLESSCACPFVPRLMLIEIGNPSSSATASR